VVAWSNLLECVYDNQAGAQKIFKGIKLAIGAAVGLVDTLTCPIVWLPTYSEEQAFYERL
jgi:hypothetical protein